MPTVIIPSEHFVTSARRNYQDIDTALVREALQNSVDAGASHIRFTVGPDFFECADNGHGMTKERMVSAMLTLSGTHKEVGSVGGFGAAKEIILFQHAEFEISSLDTHVRGKVLEYEFVQGTPIQGTRIKAVFHPSYYYKQAEFLTKARAYLESCQLPNIQIVLNDLPVQTDATEREKVREYSWGYISKAVGKANPTGYVPVRAHGVTMFQRYVGDDTPLDLAIEITRPSTEVLTANRDGFTWTVAQVMETAFVEMVINSGSFGRLFKRSVTFKGLKRTFDDLLQSIRNLLPESLQTETFQIAFTEAAQKSETLNLGTVAAEVIQEQSRLLGLGLEQIQSQVRTVQALIQATPVAQAEDFQCQFVTDFSIHNQKKGVNSVPKHLDPRTMSRSSKALAKLWKRCLKLVMLANNIREPFSIGWLLSDADEALFSKQASHVQYFLNPDGKSIQDKDGQLLFWQILSTAAHEVAHREVKWHDERFSSTYERYVVATLSYIKSWRSEIKEARKETL